MKFIVLGTVLSALASSGMAKETNLNVAAAALGLSNPILQALIEGIKVQVKKEILEDIKNNGLYLGRRWVIREEGTGSYDALVARDLWTSAGKDSRYAFWPAKYRDL